MKKATNMGSFDMPIGCWPETSSQRCRSHELSNATHFHLTAALFAAYFLGLSWIAAGPLCGEAFSSACVGVDQKKAKDEGNPAHES